MVEEAYAILIVFVVIPCSTGIELCKVKNEGQIAPIMTRTVFAPFEDLR